MRWIHRRPVNSPHKWPVTRKMFPFDDVIMHARGFVDITQRCHDIYMLFVLQLLFQGQPPVTGWFSSAKGQWFALLMFNLSSIYTNCWSNFRIACDLRYNVAHVASLFGFISLLYDELCSIVESIFLPLHTVAPMALWLSYSYPSGSEVIVNYMDKICLDFRSLLY